MQTIEKIQINLYPKKCRLPFILYPPAMWDNPLEDV